MTYENFTGVVLGEYTDELDVRIDVQPNVDLIDEGIGKSAWLRMKITSGRGVPSFALVLPPMSEAETEKLIEVLQNALKDARHLVEENDWTRPPTSSS